ncbi:MAG: hypothetical protein RL385_5536 [Pseudomonadota bacterium]|jgi:hypothetical protein
MGQRTEHTTYHCPCGQGSVVLTTTLFGGGGNRRIHTELVRCDTCKGKYRYTLVQQPDAPAGAAATPVDAGTPITLVPLTKS